ncbi:PKD domain-containing protein [Arenibacter palladensis]|uniref:PKD domain-containing protein n=1 Tax=Arenibacter palladensis TaxID=237373 RepID=UPI0026E24104|nr:PKD domain-containing protein [Arenibacter palladensis]MDO6603135.1 PKD domain-containing protein [Arenibacter palladensis]
MTKKNLILLYGIVFSMMLSLSSCSSDDSSGSNDIPFSADIFQSVVGKKVAFQGLTNNAVSWTWDFGDGTTSSEKNPVHVYSEGGYYTAKLTATSADGSSISKEVILAIDLTPYILLTGGPTATNGKTWRIASAHSAADKLADADADFSPIEQPLATGILGLLGMGEVYEDTFTFHFEGGYEIDTKADGAVFSGLVYQIVTAGFGGVVNANGQDYGLCTGLFTPDDNLTFTYVENEDLNVPSVYGPGGVLTFGNVTTLDFSGNGFLGFKDFQSKVIVQEIKDNSMRVVMFMAASQDYIGVNTHALVFTFEVVN